MAQSSMFQFPSVRLFAIRAPAVQLRVELFPLGSPGEGGAHLVDFLKVRLELIRLGRAWAKAFRADDAPPAGAGRPTG